ncbi:MAG: hypothetical protein ACOYU2_06290 [Nitrospirota bacterium]
MMLDNILKNNQKTFRKLTHFWPTLTNPKNYVIPETIEEFKQLGGIFAPKIKINSRDYYFNEKTKAVLDDFVNTIGKIREIEDTISYRTAYKTTIDFIESAIYDQLKHSNKLNSEKDIKKILQTIIHHRQTRYQFFRIVEGIELKELDSVAFGDVKLFVFSENHMNEINKYRKSNNLNGFYDRSIEPFIKKHFVNKTCISTIANGDEIKAEEIGKKKINQVINLLRFIICIFAYERIYENRVKVNLLAESYNISENTLSINVDKKIISLHYGSSRKPVQKLPLDPQMINELKECCFFDDWIHIFSKPDKTELEKAILTAIYWIGEAQNDYIFESAYIKFWTALETLFSIPDTDNMKSIKCPRCKTPIETITDKKGITKALSKGVAILLAFGGYRLIEINDVKKILKAVEKLYDKRSDVIHRGIYGDMKPSELAEICKYAVWCVLTCLGLRTQGYGTLKQIKDETNRLYNLSAKIE